MADADPATDALADPFGDLLDLEQEFHSEGYALGVVDGSRAGQIEGRVFGLEKGFEKFSNLGRLGGRAAVWNARLPPTASLGLEAPASAESGNCGEGKPGVQLLESSERLRKHIKRLCDLTDYETLSTENSEDAVSEHDDRLKDANAKATLIAKIVGEDDERLVASREGGKVKGTSEMEDFDRIGTRGT